ncbi:response regulator [Okeania hirsuta]|nr:response regulator [Okeania hirsuta]
MVSLPSYHILLIEDLDEDVFLFRDYMENSGIENFTLHHRYTLAEGRKVPREHPVDIIMLDLQLPDSFGFSTFEKIHGEFPHLPQNCPVCAQVAGKSGGRSSNKWPARRSRTHDRSQH